MVHLGRLVFSLKRFRPWQLTLLVGIGYALIVVLMTWPAVRYLSQQLNGNNEDTWIFFWNNWWLREALTNGQNPFETPFLFYPSGAIPTWIMQSDLTVLFLFSYFNSRKQDEK